MATGVCECGCGMPVAHGRRFVRYHHLPSGPDHHMWKGDDVSRTALHLWLFAHKPRTGICEHCGEHKKTEFANVSGKYKRDVDDFIELCNSCHKEFDDWASLVSHPNKREQ